MFKIKIAGGVIWVALFAMVLTSVVRSEKLEAAPHSIEKLHHKAQH